MNRTHVKSLQLLIAVSLVLAALAPAALAAGSIRSSAATPEAYNNIQIFVKTQNSNTDSFTITVYNQTGGLVATSQSEYPAFSFELPSGTYLFAVSAAAPYIYAPGGPLKYAASTQGSAIAYPIGGYYSPTEYGSLLTTISGPETFNINTTPVDQIPTTTVTVAAKFLNGTAASGASIQASVVGSWYWYYSNIRISMYNQTSGDGTATLVVPAVPIEITVWDWVQVNLPKSETTTQVNVGGQEINVTVFWQPTYVGLAGTSLIIPPTTSASVTLKEQQQNYWYEPYGVATAQSSGASSSAPPTKGGQGASSGTISNAPTGVPASLYQAGPQLGSQQQPQSVPSQIPSLPVTTTITVSASSSTSTQSSSNNASANSLVLVEAGVTAAVILAAAGIALSLRRK